MYSATVSEHFYQPRRVGPLLNATHKGVAGHTGEGRYVVLWFSVENKVVRAAAYQTYGCPAAIAAASMAAELSEGTCPGGTHALQPTHTCRTPIFGTVQTPAGATAMQYDKENRLVVSESSSGASTFTYAGDGMKRTELASGALTTLAWDGDDYLQGRS